MPSTAPLWALPELGAPQAAIDFLFGRMTLSLKAFRAEFAADLKAGPVGHRRYKLTQYPFLALDNHEFIMLRYGWAADRLCGSLLCFEAWSGLVDTQSTSLAQRFGSAMNDVFEDIVGETLQRIANHSRLIRKTVYERDQLVKLFAGKSSSQCRRCSRPM